MGFGTVVLIVSKWVGGCLEKRWHAIIDPDTYIQGKQADVDAKNLKNIRSAFEIKDDVEDRRLARIAKRIEIYKELGLSEEDIRREILPQLLKDTDAIEVLGKLGRAGIIKLELPGNGNPQSADDADEDETTPADE